jgi:RNA-directed DNA polymerase
VPIHVLVALLSNIYLTEGDRMLERAQENTYTYAEYARFADELVILIDAHKRHDSLMGAVEKRLREELAKLQVEINEEKSRNVDLCRGESFAFLGFDFHRVRSLLAPLHAQARKADGAAAETQGCVPALPNATD